MQYFVAKVVSYYVTLTFINVYGIIKNVKKTFAP